MSKITKQELLKLQKTLITDEAIGKKFNITRQAIHQMRKKYGIKSNYANNPKRDAAIVAAFKKGMSGTAIAEKMGLSVSQTYRIINEGGALKQKGAGKKKK